jgi:iron complex transport system substrate-binding protein
MIGLAGGEPALGSVGEKSYRVTWEDVSRAAPEVVVCAPCGYGLDRSSALARELVADGQLPDVPVWAVDANASFARPGPRLVDGVEALAGILHPDVVGPSAIAERIR